MAHILKPCNQVELIIFIVILIEILDFKKKKLFTYHLLLFNLLISYIFLFTLSLLLILFLRILFILHLLLILFYIIYFIYLLFIITLYYY